MAEPAHGIAVLIPAYNPDEKLLALLPRLRERFARIVLVDDGSTEGRDIFPRAAPYVEKILVHERNRGKGAALKTGFLAATGDYVGIQDADMEYDPRDYTKMLRPLVDGRADVVFGSRYLKREDGIVLRWWHTAMNRFLTWWSNVLSDLDVTDMETCYKLFRREIIQKIAPCLKEERFGFEPEVVARVACLARKEGLRVSEVAISYRPRSFKEGKKIGWRDGVRALWCIFKYNLIG